MLCLPFLDFAGDEQNEYSAGDHRKKHPQQPISDKLRRAGKRKTNAPRILYSERKSPPRRVFLATENSVRSEIAEARGYPRTPLTEYNSRQRCRSLPKQSRAARPESSPVLSATHTASLRLPYLFLYIREAAESCQGFCRDFANEYLYFYAQTAEKCVKPSVFRTKKKCFAADFTPLLPSSRGAETRRPSD